MKSGKSIETPGCNAGCNMCGVSKNNPVSAREAVCGKRAIMFGKDNIAGVEQKEAVGV